ncbi:MAG: hypothetical protein JXX28_10240, partial [Deltaproteobacteria bacterium]|nr:hypothetical protein [Deltaproteobacteria bacterium]
GVEACAQPAGFVGNADDCDDGCADCHDGGTEVCDGLDNDCDHLVDEGVKQTFWFDHDDDGYGQDVVSVEACEAPPHFVADATDCDDEDAVVHPGAYEPCGQADRDCDGVDPAWCESCLDLLDNGEHSGSGLYPIDPSGSGSITSVWCDMSLDGGGWTLVGRSDPITSNPGCAGTDSGTSFGWGASRGAVSDDSVRYSLNAKALGLVFNEVAFGSYTVGKTWGANVYLHTVSGSFLTSYAATHYVVGQPEVLVGSCTPNASGGMFRYIGFTNNTDSFHLRDVDGNGFGLTGGGFRTCYNDCGLGGNLNGQRGMVMVR